MAKANQVVETKRGRPKRVEVSEDERLNLSFVTPKAERSKSKTATVALTYSTADARYLADLADRANNGNRGDMLKQFISTCINQLVKKGELAEGLPSERN